ncbi:hypothetical protein HI914_00167 [Erysiphe necator]|nr:hypothetical protein HI914_00167 [Erysiphe necator]
MPSGFNFTVINPAASTATYIRLNPPTIPSTLVFIWYPPNLLTPQNVWNEEGTLPKYSSSLRIKFGLKTLPLVYRKIFSLARCDWFCQS